MPDFKVLVTGRAHVVGSRRLLRLHDSVTHSKSTVDRFQELRDGCSSSRMIMSTRIGEHPVISVTKFTQGWIGQRDYDIYL